MNVATSELTDNELILGYKEGDYSCFETLLSRYQSKVYGYIFSVVKDKDSPTTSFKILSTKLCTPSIPVSTRMRTSSYIG